jgi:4-alpha-glucanotransferase
MIAAGSAATDRKGGVLLHPTSLPGPYGIGDLGPTAEEWITWLSDSGCQLWQVLPLVPTGLGYSPYNGSSAFAGNPMLINLDLLVEDGLLSKADLEPVPQFLDSVVEHENARLMKEPRLKLAAERFFNGAAEYLIADYEAFCQMNRSWLDDYALFRVLKTMHGEVAWSAWDPRFSDRRSPALDTLDDRQEDQAQVHRFNQFIFFRQWERIRRLAASVGISIIGDIPIFVAHDSSDVWAHPELFRLDEQRWGNPLYDWEVIEAEGFSWWIDRLWRALRQADFVRLDHFRGFEAFWEIPRDAPTAATGKWVKGPGEKLFNALQDKLDQLPLIAEDLGVITPEVIALRDQFDLPGMRILQFGLEGGLGHADMPPSYVARSVAYTGTHDNDTSRGWYESSDSSIQSFVQEYLGCQDDPVQVPLSMIEAIWSSVANWAVAPLQDFLALDSGARMNYPGTIEGNWSWRVTPDQLTDNLAGRIRALNVKYER